MKSSWTRVYAMAAGSLDTATGLGLIFSPALSVGLMGLDAASHPMVWMRFLGAFVFAMGSLYWVGLGLSRVSGYDWAFRGAWLATGWARLCAGTVTAVLVWNGDLAIGWISVPATDLSLGLFQAFWFFKERQGSDER